MHSGGVERFGDMPDLGGHARLRDHHHATPPRHLGVHEHHVRTIGDGEFTLLEPVLALIHGLCFTGEGRFGNLQSNGFEQSPVGGNRVARVDRHDVAGHQFGVGQLPLRAISQHQRGRHGRRPQRLEAALGAVLLHEVERRVENDHEQNDDRRFPFARHDRAHRGGDQQHDRHAVGEEFQQAAEHGCLRRLVERIGSVLVP